MTPCISFCAKLHVAKLVRLFGFSSVQAERLSSCLSHPLFSSPPPHPTFSRLFGILSPGRREGTEARLLKRWQVLKGSDECNH